MRTRLLLATSEIALSEQECNSSTEAVVEEAVPELQKTSNVTRSADTFALASHCLSAWPANWQSLMMTSPNAEMICLAPSHAPPKFTLLYFSVRIDNNATTAMIDTGASHSFVTEELVQKLCLPVKTLSTPMTATDFGGTTATVSLRLSRRLSAWLLLLVAGCSMSLRRLQLLS